MQDGTHSIPAPNLPFSRHSVPLGSSFSAKLLECTDEKFKCICFQVQLLKVWLHTFLFMIVHFSSPSSWELPSVPYHTTPSYCSRTSASRSSLSFQAKANSYITCQETILSIFCLWNKEPFLSPPRFTLIVMAANDNPHGCIWILNLRMDKDRKKS